MSIGIIIGLFWGGVIGVLAMGILAAGKRSDIEIENMRLRNLYWGRINKHIKKREKCRAS